MSELQTLSITAAHAGLVSRSFSARELTEAVLRSIRERNGELNAYLHVAVESALAAADKYDENPDAFPSALAGIPMAIKDTIVTTTLPTTAGSKMLAGYISPYDATVVAKLRHAGAVIIGKTNCDEFAMGASGENSAYGPTRNPRDVTRVPGGSSSGSAAAVAADLTIAALGSDTGGSIRQPASMCGVVGVRPTYGAVSRSGLIAMASSLDTIGPLTKTVADAAHVLAAIGGADPRDTTSHQAPTWQVAELLERPIKGLRVGVPKQYFPEVIDPTVATAVRGAIKRLAELGATIVDLDLPLTEMALAAYYVIVPAEVSANLARYDGIRYGLSLTNGDLTEHYRQTRSQGFGDEVKRRIMVGTFSLSAGYADQYYLQAAKVRRMLTDEYVQAFSAVDVIAAPTAPSVAFKLGQAVDPISMYLADVFTTPASLAGLPALSVPIPVAKGLPIGLQLIGPRFGEPVVLSLAHQFEQQSAE